jgi:hypothetical protein
MWLGITITLEEKTGTYGRNREHENLKLEHGIIDPSRGERQEGPPPGRIELKDLQRNPIGVEHTVGRPQVEAQTPIWTAKHAQGE